MSFRLSICNCGVLVDDFDRTGGWLLQEVDDAWLFQGSLEGVIGHGIDRHVLDELDLAVDCAKLV